MQDFKTLHFKLFNFFYLILQATSAEIIPLDSKGSSIKSHAVVAFELVSLITVVTLVVVVVLEPPKEVKSVVTLVSQLQL